jgi:hypothetical protein
LAGLSAVAEVAGAEASFFWQPVNGVKATVAIKTVPKLLKSIIFVDFTVLVSSVANLGTNGGVIP